MIHELHPDIRKFWEDHGHNICKEPIFASNAQIWCEDNADHAIIVAIVFDAGTENELVVYRFGDITYDEPEALRIIKLAAFL